MKKHFYSNIVTLENVVEELGSLDISASEKKVLEELAHEHLHQTILDAVLSELSERDKRIFLANVEYDSHEKVWKHLHDKIEGVEDKIRDVAEKVKIELRSDVRRVKDQ